MAKNKYKNMSSKQKNRQLLVGMLAPLLIITIIACTMFYITTSKIVDYFITAEIQNKMEHINSSVLEQLDPVIVNLENFKKFATFTNDYTTLDWMIKILAQDLDCASLLYYATVESRFRGGAFLDNNGWVPPRDFDPATRGWFQDAVKNDGNITFAAPYVDAQTGEMTIAVSVAVPDKNGKTKGVVACDIVLNNFLSILSNIEVSKHSYIDLITEDGLYMTNNDASKIMNANYFEESSLPVAKEDWLGETAKVKISGKKFFAVCKVGPTPWYIIVEGPISDFKAQLSLTIIIMELVLIGFGIAATFYNIKTIKKMRQSEQKLGADLFEETQNLVVATKESAATSQDQSAAVKEIVATMEDSNALSESITRKIKNVSSIAENTSSDVAEGVAAIEQNIVQLHEIFEANQKTIDGMKILNDKIESIWDIVTLINNVADQAKIIAFNAELEASSAGEAGKSFRIVANEIRRLSDGIIDGTKEIKEKINEIQQSSNMVISTSENGTKKINEGYESAKILGNRFESIKNSAESTAESSSDITEIIQQQAMASEQILIALKQISAGIENFTVATENISSSSEHIRAMSEELNKSVKSSDNT